jgi:hypothetical protein
MVENTFCVLISIKLSKILKKEEEKSDKTITLHL